MNEPVEIYEEAARMVAMGAHKFSCCAIDAASGQIFSTEREVYCQIMLDGLTTIPEGWLREPDAQHQRVVALLFMAQWARTEGLK